MSDADCSLYRLALETEDAAAWHSFYARSQPRILGRLSALATRRKRQVSAAELEELSQEVWCRLLSPARFRGSTDPELWGWIQTILRRVLIDDERFRRAKKRQAGEVAEGSENLGGYCWKKVVPDGASNPEERVLLKERAREVVAACREASPSRNPGLSVRLLRLALVEGRSSQGIAGLLEETVEARQVDVLLHRLRRRFAERGLCLPHRSVFAAS